MCLPEGVHPLDDDWKEEFFSYLSQERVGIVGGKTFGKNGKIRQNGYTCDSYGNIRPLFAGLPSKFKGYCRRAVLAQEVEAVAFEFAMIKKEAYDKIGGWDESLPHPYREMDFCLRLRKAGYAVIQTPYAQAIVEKEPDFKKNCGKEDEAKERLRGWMEKEGFVYDPCYNPNFAGEGKTFAI